MPIFCSSTKLLFIPLQRAESLYCNLPQYVMVFFVQWLPLMMTCRGNLHPNPLNSLPLPDCVPFLLIVHYSACDPSVGRVEEPSQAGRRDDGRRDDFLWWSAPGLPAWRWPSYRYSPVGKGGRTLEAFCHCPITLEPLCSPFPQAVEWESLCADGGDILRSFFCCVWHKWRHALFVSQAVPSQALIFIVLCIPTVTIHYVQASWWAQALLWATTAFFLPIPGRRYYSS